MSCIEKFNGGYIKAFENKSETYKAIINSNIICGTTFNRDANYWYIEDNQLKHANIEYLQHFKFKQFYINNEILSWEEPKINKDELTYEEAQKPIHGITNEKHKNKITRIEVIGKEGREFSSWLVNGEYKLSYLDNGKTLKLFETPIKSE